MNKPSDELLSAWLDGELDAAQRAQVDAWLQEYPEDAARVRLWAADREAIAARFESVLAEPVPPRLEQIVWTRAIHRVGSDARASMAVAAAVLSFIVGASLGAAGAWRWADRQDAAAVAGETGWVQRAAVAHRVYVGEKRHPVEVDIAAASSAERAELEDHLQRWLTRRVDVPVKLFDLRSQGFELVGGRLLPDEPMPAGSARAMLMYQQSGGQRVTVYLRRAADAVPASFRYEQQGELGLFYWVEGQAGYALAGALPREQLLALARAIYAQQPTAAPLAAPVTSR